ncbi:MAG: amidohydrolase family protein, partial [Gemmatimonadales bacterium]
IDAIKVHSLTPRVAYFTILAAAKRHGIPVVGHVPESVSVREAIEAGQHTIEHNTRVELAMTPRGDELSNWALGVGQHIFDRFAVIPVVGPLFALRLAVADSALAAYDSATAYAFGSFAAERPVWFAPTLTVMEALYRGNDPAYRRPPELKYAPAASLEMDEGMGIDTAATEAQLEAGRARLARQLTTIPPLINTGVKLITGTDAPVYPLVPGFSLHRELELLVQAGLTPMQAIQAATRNSAEAAGRLADLGTIEPGKRGSMVLLSADPLADISNTRQIDAVLLNGRFLDRATLDRMLADALTYAQSTRRAAPVTEP